MVIRLELRDLPRDEELEVDLEHLVHCRDLPDVVHLVPDPHVQGSLGGCRVR